MATAKQLALRIKYAKTSLNSLTKKLNAGKAKLKMLDADLKTAKASVGKRKKNTGSTGPRAMKR